MKSTDCHDLVKCYIIFAHCKNLFLKLKAEIVFLSLELHPFMLRLKLKKKCHIWSIDYDN